MSENNVNFNKLRSRLDLTPGHLVVEKHAQVLALHAQDSSRGPLGKFGVSPAPGLPNDKDLDLVHQKIAADRQHVLHRLLPEIEATLRPGMIMNKSVV